MVLVLPVLYRGTPVVERARQGSRRLRAATVPEHAEQAAVVAWCGLRARQDPRYGLLFAQMNAGQRSWATARWAQAQGMRAGVPDLVLPVPAGGYHGLFIEMKRPGGTLTPAQRWWHAALGAQKYRVAVCRSADDAIRTLQEYVGT